MSSSEKATAVPSVQTLRSWLPLYISKADKTVDHLLRILSTPSGTDTLLLTVCYGSLLSSSILSSISLHRLHGAVRQFIEKAISLPPNTTVIIDTSAIPPSRLLITAKRLRALSSLISDFRIFSRLWGLLRLWKWGKSTLQNPAQDMLLRRIAHAQVLVNILFQTSENGAYLSSKGVLGWSKKSQGRAWLWSSRFWMAHVGLDFVRLYREYTLYRLKTTAEQRREGGAENGVVTDSGDAELRAKWRKDVISNLAWAPLTVHWSSEKGLVSEFWVGLLGTIVGVTGFRDLWKNTSVL